MAKKAPAKAAKSATGGKPLVIVESPAKARTISKFLGSNYMIEASIGHIRDLPQGQKEVPAKYKKTEWGKYAVNVEGDFEPIYVVPPAKREQVNKLKGLLKNASEVYLATDEDREGEAISWHLAEVLDPKVPVHRLVFHEITKTAIQEALDHPRDIDNNLVSAQETRRIVDRLYGYGVSPLLWRKVRPQLSAGRVQSVAVRLIVQRERERMAFVSGSYWDLEGKFAKADGQQLEAGLSTIDGKRIPAAKDFDPDTGRLTPEALTACKLLSEGEACDLAARLVTGPFTVASIEDKPFNDKPSPPFETSTLQQAASSSLKFTPKRTMQIAQSLYENGHITYMRTDSTALAKEAVDAVRKLIQTQYGPEYLPSEPRNYQTQVKNAQEAHEAIRPASHFMLPEQLRDRLNADEFKLYDLIWKRTVACQMVDAKRRRLSVILTREGANFQKGAVQTDFPGHLRAYVEGSDDPEATLAGRDTSLPPLVVGEQLKALELTPQGHATKPPARYTETALIKALKDQGIGRPSTYAAIIDTIQSERRNYVFKKGTALVPTWTAFAVVKLLEDHLPKLVDLQFTAKMEEDLDEISRGERPSREYLKHFFHGNGEPGLRQLLDHKVDEIDARQVCSIPLPAHDGAPSVTVRVGRYGPYLEDGPRRVSLPDGTAPDELTAELIQKLFEQAAIAEQPLGYCPETGKAVYLKIGRFGPYVQMGQPDEEEKPKNASLLPGMKPEDINLATALKLLKLPREVGIHPEKQAPITAFNGRFGPYLKCGEETRSLPAGMSPLDVTLEQATELINQPKQARRGFGAPRAPLKVFDKSPVTGEPVQLFDGRYGLYVADGTTNASLPKGLAAEALTLEEALRLLAERAALGPPAKKSKRRGAAKKAPKAAPAEAEPAATATATRTKKAPAKKKAAKKKKKKSADD